MSRRETAKKSTGQCSMGERSAIRNRTQRSIRYTRLTIGGTTEEELNNRVTFYNAEISICVSQHNAFSYYIPRNQLVNVKISLDWRPYTTRLFVRSEFIPFLDRQIRRSNLFYERDLDPKNSKKAAITIHFHESLSDSDILFMKNYFDIPAPSIVDAPLADDYPAQKRFETDEFDDKDKPSMDEDKKSDLEQFLPPRQLTKVFKSPSGPIPADRFPEFDSKIELFKYVEISLTMEDYKCLDYRDFITNTVLDFYLQYIHLELMPPEKSERVFIYSAQMYHELSIGSDCKSAAESFENARLHHKDLNIFEKDFLVIPCFKNAHWFLAIICYPYLNGCIDADGQKWPIEAATEKDKNATIKPLKASSILIFDSCENEVRAMNAINLLQDFLTREYETIYHGQEAPFNMEEKNILDVSVKCPQQRNSRDCGLFLLEFVELFFVKNPIEDFRFPLDLSSWINAGKTLNKRYQISRVMESKIEDAHHDTEIELPRVIFFDTGFIHLLGITASKPVAGEETGDKSSKLTETISTISSSSSENGA